MKKDKFKEVATYHAGQKRGYWWKYLLAALIIFIYLMPLYVLVMRSFKGVTDMSTYMSIPEILYLDNYRLIFKEGVLFRAFFNSGIITVSTVVIEIVLACMAAYPLARNRTRFNGLVQNIFMGVMMIPPLTILVGVYSFLVGIRATNTYWGLVLTLVAFGLPLAVFLFTNFITAIPRALDEASIIDGASVLQTFFYIILPQLKPIIATVTILHGVSAWNEYAYSQYIMQKNELVTVTLAIRRYFSSVSNDYGGAAAAAVIAILPITILYLILQDYFIQGQVDSAIK